MSPWMTVRLGCRATISLSAETISPSASIAITLPACRANSRVRIPSPGPTSITVSSGVRSAAATIRLRTRPSTRKCWPRPFLARRPDCLSRLLALVVGSSTCSGKEASQNEIRVVHLTSTLPCGFPLPDSSDQEILWHPEAATYRCFLPDLTGFIAFCRTGPDLQYQPTKAVPQNIGHRTGIQPRYSGFRVQGTANSPPSTTQSQC